MCTQSADPVSTNRGNVDHERATANTDSVHAPPVRRHLQQPRQNRENLSAALLVAGRIGPGASAGRRGSGWLLSERYGLASRQDLWRTVQCFPSGGRRRLSSGPSPAAPGQRARAAEPPAPLPGTDIPRDCCRPRTASRRRPPTPPHGWTPSADAERDRNSLRAVRPLGWRHRVGGPVHCIDRPDQLNPGLEHLCHTAHCRLDARRSVARRETRARPVTARCTAPAAQTTHRLTPA